MNALTARQRRLLVSELCGRRPAARDVPVLRYWARAWALTTGLKRVLLGFALLVVVALQRNARDAGAFLARTDPTRATAPPGPR